MSPFKRALRASLASRWLSWIGSPLTRGGLSVFTLHRFGEYLPTNMGRMNPGLLDAVLSRLRHDGYRFMDLYAAIRALETGAHIPARSVVFTVDDGYADFEKVAEVFLHHACPLTVFLTTGFIDGTTWLWWDKVEYYCLNAPAGVYTVEGGPGIIALTDELPDARLATVDQLFGFCKMIPEADKQRFLRELAVATGVSLPPRPPDVYAPLTWDKIRSLEGAGVHFAPHTVTHPILSRTDDEQAEFEITESWRRVRQEVKQPTPVLAYPNGRAGDFGERESRILEEAGLIGAVTTIPGYLTSDQLRKPQNGRYTLPRMAQPVDPDGACLTASGFDRVPRRWRIFATRAEVLEYTSDARGSGVRRVPVEEATSGLAARCLKQGSLRCMKRAGLFRTVARSRWRQRRLAILMYHGVSLEDEHAWNPNLYMYSENFRESLEAIRRTDCEVLPLKQAVDHLYAGNLPDRAVALTFDDGNFDFAERVVPLLTEFGYPATVFVSTYYSSFQRPVFNTALGYLLWKGQGRSVVAAGLAAGNEPLATDRAQDRQASWWRISRFAEKTGLSGEDKHELLALLAKRLDVDFEALTAARMFHLMRPDELAALPPGLVDVQLHTHRHRTPRDRDPFLQEVSENRASLSRALCNGHGLDQFCYPSGDYIPEYVPWLEGIGIELAVTCEAGLASPRSNRMLLPRIPVTTSLTSVALEAWLTGAREFLPRRRST